MSYVVFFLLFVPRTPVPASLKDKHADEFAIFCRPYDAPSLKAAFLGPWIPHGAKDSIRNFYRPFAIVAYASLYELCERHIQKLHLYRQVFSFLKFAAFFGVLYFLSNGSLWTAFLATLLYSISFKLFDEHVIFQGLPDLIVTTFFFSGLFFFILFSNRTYGQLQTIGLGILICLFYILSVGTKENALFLFPTLFVYRLIHSWNREYSFSAQLKRVLDRKHLILFCALGMISIIYFFVRHYALGTDHALESSWGSRGIRSILNVMFNVMNNFSLIPWTFVDYSFADNYRLAVVKVVLNLILPAAGIYLIFFSDIDSVLKKSIAFSLALILLNTIFYTQGVRVRFNAIGNLGAFYIAAITLKRIARYARIPHRDFVTPLLTYSLLIAGLYVYVIQNVWNVLQRTDPIYPHVSFQASFFDYGWIIKQIHGESSKTNGYNSMNRQLETKYVKPTAFSFFVFAMALQTEHSTLDCFDITYRSLAHGPKVQIQLDEVEKKAMQITTLKEYRQQYTLGLISAARVVLIPKQAFEERSKYWSAGFDMNGFRKDFQTAVSSFESCGSIGQGILKQLQRAAKRMDKDDDGKFSDAEIEQFLSPKLTAAKQWVSEAF